MTVAVFDVRGPLAHFRRPDTLATHATYPFPPRTALRGLVAAILGLGELPAESRAGLRLLKPVRTSAQELSLHGKTWEAGSGAPASFHRPTSVELIVDPAYRVYYSGPLVDELSEAVRGGRSHYHTYLGSAFCLTFPEWRGLIEPADAAAGPVSCASVVPAPAVGKLLPAAGSQYARVGGVAWETVGPFRDRRFSGSVAVMYEVAGGPIAFEPTPPDPRWRFAELPGEGTVCLW